MIGVFIVLDFKILHHYLLEARQAGIFINFE